MKHFGHKGHTGQKKSRLAVLKGRATYLLTILVLIAGGYLAFSAWNDFSIGVPTTGMSVADIPEDFEVSANLDLPDETFDLADVTLKITLGEAREIPSGGKLSIDGLNMEGFQGASVVLNGYDGSLVRSDDDTIQLQGKVTSAIMNNVVINKNGETIPIKTSDLQFDSVLVSDISVKSFSLVSTGVIDVADKGSFAVNNEKLEMKPFNGFIKIDSSGLQLKGTTDNLLIESIPRISVE